MGVVLGNALVVLAAIGFSGLLHNRFHQDRRVEMRMFSMPSSIVAESILFCRRLRRHVGQPLLRQRPPCRVILARRTIDQRDTTNSTCRADVSGCCPVRSDTRHAEVWNTHQFPELDSRSALLSPVNRSGW